MRIAVIGAGPAGMTAAFLLSRGGADVEVFEKERAVGGLCRSLELWGNTVDLGPHRFFSKDPRVNRLWLEVVGRDYRMVERLTRIYYRKRFFLYPLQPADALRKMGIADAARCLASYARQKLVPSGASDATFEGWVVSRFGRRLFEMFFRSYSEKLWGIPCAEIDADFAAQRIKKFSLGEAVLKALGVGRARHATLVDRFAYPLGGTGMVYERMAGRVREAGGRIRLGTAVRRVARGDGGDLRVELEDGAAPRFDRVLSTMPLPALVGGLGRLPPEVEAAAGALRFRSTILVYLLVEEGRLSNFANWVPQIRKGDGSTVVSLEFWCDRSDALWSEDDPSLAARAERELASTGLLKGAKVSSRHVVRIPASYPVYARGYKENLAKVVGFLGTVPGLIPLGRAGAFKYNNQDHSILMGILAAENLLEGKDHDLWSVNSDKEYHESAVITEEGLVASG